MKRERSIEQLVRRAHRRMVFWRFVGDCIEVPYRLIQMLGAVFVAIMNGFCGIIMSFSRTVFYLELEAARQYKSLTGTDLGYAVGDPTRYGGLSPERAARTQEAMFRGVPLDEVDDE
jgi:hypothetical protein